MKHEIFYNLGYLCGLIYNYPLATGALLGSCYLLFRFVRSRKSSNLTM